MRVAQVVAAAGRLQQIPLRQIQRPRLPGTRQGQTPELSRCNRLFWRQLSIPFQAPVANQTPDPIQSNWIPTDLLIGAVSATIFFF